MLQTRAPAAPIGYSRSMLARLAAFALVLPLTVAACGAPPPPETPAKAASDAPADAPAKKPQGKSLVEHRRDFMERCSSKVPNAPDYCECGWEQMTKTFTEDEMNDSSDGHEDKLAKLKDRVEATCKSKLPEDFIKRLFVKGCDGDMPKLTPYCECTWTELRKKLSTADMGDASVTKTDRFTSAKKDAVKVCGPKMPEDIAKQAFLTGCAQDPKLEGFCGCAWKELRKEKSAADVEAGFFDMEAMKPKVDKACGKMRPK
jgi:hypothetical protein